MKLLVEQWFLARDLEFVFADKSSLILLSWLIRTFGNEVKIAREIEA